MGISSPREFFWCQDGLGDLPFCEVCCRDTVPKKAVAVTSRAPGLLIPSSWLVVTIVVYWSHVEPWLPAPPPQCINHVVSLEDKPSNYCLDQWLSDVQICLCRWDFNMPLLLKEDMEAPKDAILYKQTKFFFFFGKNSRFLAFKTYSPFSFRWPTCWARGWVARKVMQCSFSQMVL